LKISIEQDSSLSPNIVLILLLKYLLTEEMLFSPNKHHPDITGTGMLSTKGFGGGWPMSSVARVQ
jgi:hypothetical protein